jgi:hypothetical protein
MVEGYGGENLPMTFQRSNNALRMMLMLALVISVPTFVFGQKKTEKAAPSKPAQAAPAQHSQSGNASHPGTSNTSHPGTNNTSRPGTSGSTRPGNTPNSTNRPGTTGNNMGHPGTNNANRGGAGNNAGRGNTGNAGNAAHGGNGAHAGNAARPGVGHTPPGRQVSLRGGGSASIRPNGSIRSVNRNGMHIDRGMHGERRVVSTRNGVRVVSVGRRGGYVQRAYVVRGGHSYYSRTYYYHGAYRAGVYRGYYYGGRPYYGYYPGYYYHPAYYGWAYNPWPAPVAYGWGWGGSPWYGYYGAYYAPYPVYPSAAFWITDFMISATLQAAYEANANAWLGPDASQNMLVASLAPMAAPEETAKMSPEVKKAISEEVKAVLAAEQADASKPKSAAPAGGSQPAQSNEAPPSLDPNFKTFIVSDDNSLTIDGQECALAQGDVIERTTDTPDDDGNVNVKVVASNKNDCGIGKEGPISTDDLQDMYNSFRESLKDGMGELAKKNGTGGLPKAPDTTTSDGDVPAPPPDKSAEKSLQDQQAAADQTESDVKQEAASGGGSN